MKNTSYYAKYKTSDGKERYREIFRFRKSMIGKPLWIEPYNVCDVPCTDLIVAETSDDYTDRGWCKVLEVVKEQRIIRTTKVY